MIFIVALSLSRSLLCLCLWPLVFWAYTLVRLVCIVWLLGLSVFAAYFSHSSIRNGCEGQVPLQAVQRIVETAHICTLTNNEKIIWKSERLSLKMTMWEMSSCKIQYVLRSTKIKCEIPYMRLALNEYKFFFFYFLWLYVENVYWFWRWIFALV